MNPATEVMISISTYDGYKKAMDKEAAAIGARHLVAEEKLVYQSLGDQIWFFYRFATEADKKAFLAALSTEAQACVQHEHRGEWGKP